MPAYRSLTKFVSTALLIGMGLTLSPTAQAQISGKGGPVMWGGDHLETNAKDHTQLLEGNVELLQDTSRLRADHVKIFSGAPKGDSAGTGFGEIIRIEADGNIYYIDSANNQIIKGDHAVYTKADDNMVITGDVILRQGDNVSTGNRLTFNQTTGESRFDNAGSAANKGRIVGVFFPDNKPASKPKP